MGYSQRQKAETHASVLRIATRMLRKDGPERLSVADVMHAAGLTHGGFYAHFESREALLLEALESIFEDAANEYRRIGEGLAPREALLALVDAYVSARHRGQLSRCPIVTLNSDVSRQSKAFRLKFAEGTAKLVSILADWMRAAGISDAETQAAVQLSAMAGAIAVARAVADERASDLALETARQNINRSLGLIGAGNHILHPG